VHSDLFSGLEGQLFDLIISNPPYVDIDDFDSMPDEFHHEPELALYSGQDGLDFTRRLLREAEDYLSETGILVVEVGNSSEALEKAFPSVPFFWFEFPEAMGASLCSAESSWSSLENCLDKTRIIGALSHLLIRF
jgi:ribosomal protein L3 glutamine methyltransferase